MKLIPSPPVTLIETAPAPVEQAILPPIPLNKEWVALLDEDGNWNIVIQEGEIPRHPTENEAKQVASYMNEQGSNIITLYCRTDKCKHKGTWIRRSSEDAKKNMYFCDGCKGPLIR